MLLLLRFYGSLLFLLSWTSSATEIKWTAGDSKNDPAATAPRSQRYWDKNNIPRPDYAKTDAEVAAEQGLSAISSIGNPAIIMFVVMALFGVFAGWHVRSNDASRGDRLGGNTRGPAKFLDDDANCVDDSDGDAIRRARLARFEENGSKED